MRVELRHVQRRGNSLFFRMEIPSEVREHFGGKSEINKTLRTSDPYIAFQKASLLSSSYQEQFNKLRSNYIADTNTERVHSIFQAPQLIQQEVDVKAPPKLSEMLEELLQSRTLKRENNRR